ncbi:hypothetical protein ACIQI7_34180 [Kitasatospora sp. NPDC092039]|uniref:hypothetical protein n=1 Tax=Kitasatospora sp. NPDC092039 TaxID=3364086 RepID=UPI00381522B2
MWQGLVGPAPPSWCRGPAHGRYTPPPPHGAGTTREITARQALRLREEFPHWGEGRRHALRVTRATLPLYRRFGEDDPVEPLPGGGTRFTWTFAYEPRPLPRRPAALTDLPATAFPRTPAAGTKRHFRAA